MLRVIFLFYSVELLYARPNQVNSSSLEQINSILQRFNDGQLQHPVVTLWIRGSHLQEGEMVACDNEKQYQELTGSLTYAAMSMWPEIGYIMQYLSQSNKKTIPMRLDHGQSPLLLEGDQGHQDHVLKRTHSKLILVM